MAVLTIIVCFSLPLLILSFSLLQNKGTVHSATYLNFKKTSTDNEGGDSLGNGSWGVWRAIKRFLPGSSKAKVEKTYETPLTDSGMRYHLRLKAPITNTPTMRRHYITRILRFMPDIKWETASEIVDRTNEKGIALLRVLNSKKDAKYFVDMFRNADPPVNVEVYDSKSGDIVVV